VAASQVTVESTVLTDNLVASHILGPIEGSNTVAASQVTVESTVLTDNLVASHILGPIEGSNTVAASQVTVESTVLTDNLVASHILGPIEGSNTISASDITVTGNLTVLGTTTTVDTENLLVKDPIITVSNAAAAVDAGLLINRQENNVFAGFDTSAGEYTIGFTDNSGLDAVIDIKDNTNFVANVHGNVHANYFIGDGSKLTNLPSGGGGGASTLQEVTDLGNVTSNVVQFTATGTSLVATGDIESKNIRLNDPSITTSFAGGMLTIDAANKTYGTGSLITLTENMTDLSYSNLINGAQVVIPILSSGSYYISNTLSNVNFVAYTSNVDLTNGNHGLITISNLYSNIYVNALGFNAT